MNSTYIVGSGMFLPGAPVENDSIEKHLGMILNKPSRSRNRILGSNQIQRRHYAIDNEQRVLHSNAEMAKEAIMDALSQSPFELSDLELLTTATTMGDVIVPGHASMVHGELGGPEMEVSSSQGVCASSMMALKNAFLQIQTGEKTNAVACGSEFVSRTFRSKRFDSQALIQEKGVAFETEFLRWMLSDGAGAVVLSRKPRETGLSLKIEFIDIKSYANKFDVCMYLGGQKNPRTGKLENTCFTEEDEAVAFQKGYFNLRQDIRMLDDVFKIGVDHFNQLVRAERIRPQQIDWMICHYSSHFFRDKIFDYLAEAKIDIPESKWYTNLYERGNTGAASIFIMLNEFLRTQDFKPGQKVACMVPESGRFISAWMLCTVVENG